MTRACGGGSAARIASEGNFREPLPGVSRNRRGDAGTPCKKKAARNPPSHRTLRLSRSHRAVESPSLSEQVPLRRIVLWTVVALAVVIGVVLYFVYEPR